MVSVGPVFWESAQEKCLERSVGGGGMQGGSGWVLYPGKDVVFVRWEECVWEKLCMNCGAACLTVPAGSGESTVWIPRIKNTNCI